MLHNFDKYTKEERALIIAGLVIAGILLIVLLAIKPFWGAVLLGIALFIYFNNVKQKAEDLDHKLFCKRCGDIISEHKTALINEKRRLSHRDAYGNVSADKWYRDGVSYFINRVLRPRLTPEQQAYLEKNNNYSEIAGVIDRVATLQMQPPTAFRDAFTGIEYEDFCKGLLEERGWSVIKTATTGDQGVDLVATKQDVRVAIQCKRYAGTIGNSAVQQVATGRLLYATNYAVVVSNSSYTKSAVELARSANVTLLHHEDLSREDFYR